MKKVSNMNIPPPPMGQTAVGIFRVTTQSTLIRKASRPDSTILSTPKVAGCTAMHIGCRVNRVRLKTWSRRNFCEPGASSIPFSAKSWLTTILRRENARKYERKRLEYSDVDTGTVASEHQHFYARPELLALRATLRQLIVKYMESLMLQVIDGYSLSEIAVRFDLPRNTVATRLHQAR